MPVTNQKPEEDSSENKLLMKSNFLSKHKLRQVKAGTFLYTDSKCVFSFRKNLIFQKIGAKLRLNVPRVRSCW